MGKNDYRPCFCGSGKDFKSCCKGKTKNNKRIYSDDVLSNPNRINSIMQEKLKSTDYKVCFHPNKAECKKPIKNAHTIQNNGVLSIISENDKVRITDLFNKIRSGTATREVRRKNATTFYGFCEFHDSAVFSDIENYSYNESIKQNFLHAYRTCSQEYHKKNRMLKAVQESFKENPSVYNELGFVESYTNMEMSASDVEEYMNIFNTSIENSNFEIIDSYVYKFSKVYDFAVTTMFSPTYDLKGNLLNDIYSNDEERLKSIFVSFLPSDENSYLIISWLKEDSEHFESYINDIKEMNEEMLKIFLNNLLPTYSENIVLSPRLWNRWTPFSRKEFERVVCGEVGDFGKLLSGEWNFESIEDFIEGMLIKNGLNNMTEKPKYDLFKL